MTQADGGRKRRLNGNSENWVDRLLFFKECPWWRLGQLHAVIVHGAKTGSRPGGGAGLGSERGGGEESERVASGEIGT
jgi:hypothetical protein